MPSPQRPDTDPDFACFIDFDGPFRPAQSERNVASARHDVGYGTPRGRGVLGGSWKTSRATSINGSAPKTASNPSAPGSSRPGKWGFSTAAGGSIRQTRLVVGGGPFTLVDRVLERCSLVGLLDTYHLRNLAMTVTTAHLSCGKIARGSGRRSDRWHDGTCEIQMSTLLPPSGVLDP